MANIKDPAFWKRFSVAVHLDEEASGTATPAASTPVKGGSVSMTSLSPTSSARPPMKHSDSWLARQHQKRRRAKCICWSAAIMVLITIGAAIFIVWWLIHHDWKF